MLPKPYRLNEERDIKRVLTYGRSFFVKDCGIKILKRSVGTESRIGIVVPKKITKTIVKRNRIKRQIRHIFIQNHENLLQGFDIIFLARNNFINLSFEEMQKIICTILKKLNIWKNIERQ